jgi:hypothetical protein
VSWDVLFHGEFDAEFEALREDVQDNLLAADQNRGRAVRFALAANESRENSQEVKNGTQH